MSNTSEFFFGDFNTPRKLSRPHAPGITSKSLVGSCAVRTNNKKKCPVCGGSNFRGRGKGYCVAQGCMDARKAQKGTKRTSGSFAGIPGAKRHKKSTESKKARLAKLEARMKRDEQEAAALRQELFTVVSMPKDDLEIAKLVRKPSLEPITSFEPITELDNDDFDIFSLLDSSFDDFLDPNANIV